LLGLTLRDSAGSAHVLVGRQRARAAAALERSHPASLKMLGCMHALLLAGATTQLLDGHNHTAPQCTAENSQPTTAELIGQHAAPMPAECSPAAAPDADTPAASTPASLPLEIYQSARRGELQSVAVWLGKGGSVDALCSTTSQSGEPATFGLLHAAAVDGHLELVRELLKRGASVDLPSSLGGTALMDAAFQGYRAIVLVLLQHSANPDLQDIDGQTALMLTAAKGHEACVRALLQAEANTELLNNKGRNALQWAEMLGHTAIAQLLRQHAAPPHRAVAAPAAPPDADEPAVSTPASLPLDIFESARRGELQSVAVWLGNGGSIDALCSASAASGEPATFGLLHVAAAHDHLEMVRELLKRGASVDLPSSLGSTALMAAAHSGHLSIVLVLLQHSADPDLQNIYGHTALMGAADQGDEACVQALLRAKANTELLDKYGYTALQYAEAYGHTAIAQLLRQHAAPPHRAVAAPAAPPDAGEPAVSTPASLPLEIFQSAERGELQSVGRWLSKGGAVDALCSTTTASGKPAAYGLLHAAAGYGHLELVRELLKRGASVDLQSSLGSTAPETTALMEAAVNGQLSIVRVLLQHAADPDLQATNGVTALMWAAGEGHEACVQALLRAKANFALLDKDGHTALEWAEIEGHTATAALILQHACLSLGLGPGLCATLCAVATLPLASTVMPLASRRWVVLLVLMLGAVALGRTPSARAGKHRAARQRRPPRLAHAKAQGRASIAAPTRQPAAAVAPQATRVARAAQAARADHERAVNQFVHRVFASVRSVLNHEWAEEERQRQDEQERQQRERREEAARAKQQKIAERAQRKAEEEERAARIQRELEAEQRARERRRAEEEARAVAEAARQAREREAARVAELQREAGRQRQRRLQAALAREVEDMRRRDEGQRKAHEADRERARAADRDRERRLQLMDERARERNAQEEQERQERERRAEADAKACRMADALAHWRKEAAFLKAQTQAAQAAQAEQAAQAARADAAMEALLAEEAAEQAKAQAPSKKSKKKKKAGRGAATGDEPSEAPPVPDQYICPITAEIMTDPVSTVRTYCSSLS